MADERHTHILDLGLRGKIALVVGAGLGIGESTALALAEAGCRVACLDLNPERADSVARRIRSLGAEAIDLQGDVRVRAEVDQAVAKVVDTWGNLDVVADIVGEARWSPIIDVLDSDWDWVFDLCLRQELYVAQAAAKELMAKGKSGAFVSISSISGLAAAPSHGPYGAAKAGLIALTKTLAVELAPYGIRVNSVAPGGIASPRAKQTLTSEQQERIARATPLSRQGTTEEIAKVSVFLLSALSSYMTGQTLIVDGGRTLAFQS